MTVSSQFPITLDLLMTVILTELNRYVNERRRQELYRLEDREASPIREKEDWKKWELNVDKAAPRLDCMAAVVGWRELPELFRRALDSYATAQGCVFLLIGIDGDDAEDQDMVNVFNEVISKAYMTSMLSLNSPLIQNRPTQIAQQPSASTSPLAKSQNALEQSSSPRNNKAVCP